MINLIRQYCWEGEVFSDAAPPTIKKKVASKYLFGTLSYQNTVIDEQSYSEKSAQFSFVNNYMYLNNGYKTCLSVSCL